MKHKLSVNELLNFACQEAELSIENQISALLDTYEQKSPEDLEFIEKLESYLLQIREYRKKRWGKSKVDEFYESLKPISIPDLFKKINEVKKID